jgi:hypothetical protein
LLLLPSTRIRNHSHVRQANIRRRRRWPPCRRPSEAGAPRSSIGQADTRIASRPRRTRKNRTSRPPEVVERVRSSASVSGKRSA